MHDGQQRLRALEAPRLLLQMLGWKVEMAACYHTGGGGGGAEAWGGGQRCVPERKQLTFSFFFLDGFQRLGETVIQKFV